MEGIQLCQKDMHQNDHLQAQDKDDKIDGAWPARQIWQLTKRWLKKEKSIKEDVTNLIELVCGENAENSQNLNHKT